MSTVPSVCFVVRSDSVAKHGGDSVQVAEYVRVLRENGIAVSVVPFSPSMVFPPRAIIHVVNIDRPFDLLTTAQLARGHRMVISPIHHSLRFVRQMRLHEQGYGMRSFIGKVLPENYREWLAFGARSFKLASSRQETVRAFLAFIAAIQHVPSAWSRVGKLLDKASAVLLLAKGEGENLRQDLGWLGRNGVLLPNGQPRRTGEPSEREPIPWELKDIPILSVGRIEPRKRQLDVARQATAMGVPVTFIGALLQPHTNFGKQFLELVHDNPHVRWLGEMSHEDVLSMMARTRVFLNASWVEVQSLVDIEAAFQGCLVVANDGGNSAEWLPNSVTEVRGSNIAEMLHQSIRLAKQPIATSVYPDYSWTWNTVGLRLLDIYKEIHP